MSHFATLDSMKELVSLNRDKTPVFDVSKAGDISKEVVDAFCQLLISQKVDKVTFLNASNEVQLRFRQSCFMLAAKFLVSFETV